MVRFILIVVFFLISLLCLFPAPTFHLWLLSIPATEYSWVFILIMLALMMWRDSNRRRLLAGSVICAGGMAIFASPIISAYRVSAGLEKEISAAFRVDKTDSLKESHRKPFHFQQMFGGTKEKGRPYQTMLYDSSSDYTLRLDYYRAMEQGNRPVVVVIHGGSWSGGDSRQLPELNSHLAQQGYHVAAINYRLAPKYISPAPVEDVRKALEFLKRQANILSIDTTKIVLLGRSAGAQIALLAAYTSADEGLKGVVSLYGPADMVWGYSLPANPLVMDSRQVMSDYLGGTYEKVPKSYYDSSPVEFVSQQSVPTLMIHGGNDPLVAYEHNIRLIKKLRASGVQHYLLTLPWATHGFDYTINGPGGQLSTYAVEEFLKAVLK